MNQYGLIGDARGKSITIWSNERVSKYLLSYKYIPSNFEGLLIGPSLSDNLNTKSINDIKIYNGSITGGNISELKLVTDNVIQRGNLKLIIICLTPYVMKNHGCKTFYISPSQYWASFGSKETLKFYIEKFLIKLDHSTYNDYGYNDINSGHLLPSKIRKKPRSGDLAPTTEGTNFFIDEVAYAELAQIIALCRTRQVKIFGYYHPIHNALFNEASFNLYKERMDRLFSDEDVIWNFNTDTYLRFRSNGGNYNDDRLHLTPQGADFLIREIQNKLKPYYGLN
jgi:lysophospholipase L1-like esterase